MSTLISLFKKPLFLGTLIGITIGTAYLPGGFDALNRLMRNMPDNLPTPAWVYLITYPMSFLGWPLSWQVLVIITILIAAIANELFFPGKSRWWIATLNAAMLWNIWLGNIEVFTIAGLLIGYMVLQKKIHPIWWGIGVITLGTKPQVGLGIIIFFTYCIWKAFDFKKLSSAVLPFLAVLVLTWIIWPGWILNWVHNSLTTSYDWWNGSIFPWGLIAWIPAFLPVAMPGLMRLRLISAATILSSPYMALYHCTTLITMYKSPLVLFFSYGVIALGYMFTNNWMKLAWLFPASLILLDMISIFINRGKQNNVLQSEIEGNLAFP